MHSVHRLRRLARDKGGAVVLIFGLAVPVLALMLAIAIDFANAAAVRSQLNVAADAAAMTAVNTASNAYINNPKDTTYGNAVGAGTQRFKAQAGSVKSTLNVTPTVSIARNNNLFTATVGYGADYQTAFAGILGKPSLYLSGQVQAASTTGNYVDIFVLMDVSSSMLIGATDADVSTLKAVYARGTKGPQSPWGPFNGCGLACHDPSEGPGLGTGKTNSGLDQYTMIRNGTIKAQMRIDQLIYAVGNLGTSLAAQNQSNYYRAALYSFADVNAFSGQTATPTIFQNLAATTAVANLGSAASSINPPSSGLASGNTHISNALTTFASPSYIGTPGDGSSATSRKVYVFLLTDGIDDISTQGATNGRKLAPVSTAACTTLKNTGATLVVMHTDFNANADDGEIGPIEPQIQANLQACASRSDLYFEVSSQTDINNAIQAMLTAAIAKPTKLTQ